MLQQDVLVIRDLPAVYQHPHLPRSLAVLVSPLLARPIAMALMQLLVAFAMLDLLELLRQQLSRHFSLALVLMWLALL